MLARKEASSSRREKQGRPEVPVLQKVSRLVMHEQLKQSYWT